MICRDRLAEQTGTHATKGRLVYVEGHPENRSFTDKNGNDRDVTDVEELDIPC